MDEGRIQRLAEDLNNQDVSKRENAARTLGNIAFKGKDITPAIHALVNALSDKDESVREHAAWALEHAASKGQDVTSAIPALVNALSDENEDVRSRAVAALKCAAEKGQDITPAVPTLEKVFWDGNRDFLYARYDLDIDIALAHHYINKKKGEEIEGLLMHENTDVRLHTYWALKTALDNGQDITLSIPLLANALGGYSITWLSYKYTVEILETAAEKGQDITPAVPALINELEDRSFWVKKHVSSALTHHHMNKKNWKEIEELLMHENFEVRDDTCQALENIAKKGQDITPAVPALGKALGGRDSSVRVRWGALRMLETAAKTDRDITPAIPALGIALVDDSVHLYLSQDFELRVINILEIAAKKGQDITSAIPALEKALENENQGFRWYASSALTHHHMNKKNCKRIEELLMHENVKVRVGACRALENIAKKGQDITPAVPALGKALGGRDSSVRLDAFRMLEIAAKKGQDITPTVPALGNALSDEDDYIYTGWLASLALTHHHRNKENWKEIEELLMHENDDVRRGLARELGVITHCIQDITSAVSALEKESGDGDSFVKRRMLWALVYAAFSDQDITSAIPALEKALGEENREVKRCASLALTPHYANKEEWGKIDELFVHENADVRGGTAWALEKFVKKCDSVEKLDTYQTIIKKYIENQPQGKMIEEVEMEIKISGLLTYIAKKKAELLRQQGGELLAGETVKKPKNSSRKTRGNPGNTMCS